MALRALRDTKTGQCGGLCINHHHTSPLFPKNVHVCSSRGVACDPVWTDAIISDVTAAGRSPPIISLYRFTGAHCRLFRLRYGRKMPTNECSFNHAKRKKKKCSSCSLTLQFALICLCDSLRENWSISIFMTVVEESPDGH